LRNQRTDEIPHFFCVTQILIAIAQNTAQYATTKTEKEFWAVWKEEVELDNFEAELYALINVAISATQSQKLLSWRESWVQAKIRELWAAGARLVSAQDRLLYSLLKPERLLDLIYGYILFDAGDKKIARYQQYFAVKATIDRVKQQVRSDDSRQGGVIWHTTGSGKSLTMVMLAKALVREPSILNPKIILVNDRVDLDDQLKDTFKDCGTAPIKAKNGKHLLELLNEPKAEIITTVIDKFETVAREKGTNPSADIFVLVDESHRSQYGQVHAKMRNVFPHACYIGFTGTPLLKKDKSTAQKFGGFIHSYTMPKAVGDKAVVPIVYEGRESEFKNTEAVDKWFDRITSDLNPEQKADLKRKFKSAEPLYEADARMAEVAYDISQHFDKHFKGTKLKGQFATSSKRAAITYQKLLDIWKIRAEVIISPPDTREDNDSVNEADISEVQRFWKDMMAIYSTPKNYQDRIIEKFKSGDGEDAPDLLIVVDKLLTGFDAPRNAVLYIDKRLKEHNILQAIARVNRVFENKDYGLVIDYRGIFGEMTDALEIYDKLERDGFDREDVEGALVDVRVEIAKLPTLHAAVWDVFKGVNNLQDTESLQQWLEPQDRRDEFYEALRDFAKNLRLALSNAPFQADTPEPTKQRYLQDLKSWIELRDLVKIRYGEKVDYSKYSDQIRRMVEKEIGASEFITIIEPVDIFDLDRSNAEIESIVGTAAQADAIAARIKKVATERMEEDPVLYLRLSELIQTAIDDHRAKRLSDIGYLQKMQSAMEMARNGGANNVPAPLQTRPQARAFYNVLSSSLETKVSASDAKSAFADYKNQSVVSESKPAYITTQSAKADFASLASISIEGDIEGNTDNSAVLVLLSIGIEDIITKHKIRDWQHHQDIQKQMMNEIDDLVHDLKKTHNLFIPWGDLDELIAKILKIAENYEVN
jgi:type I restriction enzyme, R subunit